MRNFYFLLFLPVFLGEQLPCAAQPYFQATATISGNSILYKLKPVNGDITCGWAVIEFYFRNTTISPVADGAFAGATITVNSTAFPGVSIPYNAMNFQGAETGYNNYWFGTFFFPTTTEQTYMEGQEYVLCTITLSTPPSTYNLELCHNEPNFFPDYMTLTDGEGIEESSPTGICKFYGPGAAICEPVNCPASTPGNNHILALNGSAPVELVDFQVFKNGDHAARLEWRTASERSFARYEVERQNGGDWVKIGVEEAKSTHGEDYEFFDRQPPGGSVYYRLRLVDLDGSYAFSPVRQLWFEQAESLLIHPNPVSRALHLQFAPDFPEEAVHLELCDWSGRVVLQKTLAAAGGSAFTLPIDQFTLPAGIYLFRATSERGFAVSRPVAVDRGF